MIHVIILFFLILFFSVTRFFGITINITDSMEKGIYIEQKKTISAGDIVSVCLSNSDKKFGLDRRYLDAGESCNGTLPVIKKIIAVPGDTVTLQNDFIRVNHIQYAYQTHHQDSQLRLLNAYPRGIYTNTTGYWLIGTNSQNSWDSRYWGPVKKEQILMVLKPLWIW